MNEEEKKAIEQLKYMEDDGCYKCVYGEDKTCINCWEYHKEIILNLIEKQEKIINEMADFMVHCDIDEDICQYMQDYMQDGGCGDGLECKKCIIEFYSKKVGNE